MGVVGGFHGKCDGFVEKYLKVDDVRLKKID